MGDTNIAWCDKTWNPVVGCTKVSQGCKHCYAKTLHDRRHKAFNEGKDVPEQYAYPFERVQLMPHRLEYPLHWKKPMRVFVNSVSDLFHEDIPDSFICQVFTVMRRCPQHIFQILTKRPERMQKFMSLLSWHSPFTGATGLAGYGNQAYLGPSTGYLPPNIWLGVSVENQEMADERIPLLLKTPAAVRFLSCEPLLGPLNIANALMLHSIRCETYWQYKYGEAGMIPWPPKALTPGCTCPQIHWVIAGGESGAGFRPMDLDWARSLRDQCLAAGVPYFFKQGSGRLSEKNKELDGRRWEQMPSTKG